MLIGTGCLLLAGGGVALWRGLPGARPGGDRVEVAPGGLTPREHETGPPRAVHDPGRAGALEGSGLPAPDAPASRPGSPLTPGPKVAGREERPSQEPASASRGPQSRDTGDKTADASRDARETLTTSRVTPPAVAPSGVFGCLSVNAVPFASVHVDGQYIGDTPKACLRVPVGERRVHFEADGQRSPERVVQATERHTAANPLRLSYDFRLRTFLEP